MAEELQTPPEGFVLLEGRSPFMDHNGPYYTKGIQHDLVMGAFIGEKHINNAGIVHGGFISTFADAAMGYAFATFNDPPRGALTLNLSVDFTGNAGLGDWIESRIELHKAGGRIKFANAYVVVNGKSIARASGVFMDKRAEKTP